MDGDIVDWGPKSGKRDREPRLLDGMYMGHQGRTGSVLPITSEGIIVGRGFNNVPRGQRWPLAVLRRCPARRCPLQPLPMPTVRRLALPLATLQ